MTYEEKLNQAENPSTPPEILSQLSKDEDATVRRFVAMNSSTPPEILSQLSKDEDASVRWYVAGNPSTPPEILSQLSKDKDTGIRCNVAKNPSTPPEIRDQIESSTLNEWLESHNLAKAESSVILFKRVSRLFQTQENTKNETTWTPGVTLTVPGWNPRGKECGEGKFHACDTAQNCDEFLHEDGDRYIAIEVKREDLYAWIAPQYKNKIAFRECVVLFECDVNGKRI